MRVIVVYKDKSDHAREVIEWMHFFKTQTGHELETLDPETRDGADFCRLYDIVEYPSVVAISNDGHLHQLWRGRPLPMISDISYYFAI